MVVSIYSSALLGFKCPFNPKYTGAGGMGFSIKLIVELILPRLFSNIKSLLIIANFQDSKVTTMHPLIGGITDIFKKIKDNMQTHVRYEYFVPLPIKLQLSFVFCAAQGQVILPEGTRVILFTSGSKSLMISFTNSVRETGKIATML